MKAPNLGYKSQSFIIIQENNRCLLREPYKTQTHTLGGTLKDLWMLNMMVHKISAGFRGLSLNICSCTQTAEKSSL